MTSDAFQLQNNAFKRTVCRPVARISKWGGFFRSLILQQLEKCKFLTVLNQIEAVFLSKIKWSQIKKKRSSPKFRAFFCPNSSGLTSTLTPNFQKGGGLFSFSEQKSTSKVSKAPCFAYFSGQWGGCSPPPSYATDCTFYIVMEKDTITNALLFYASKFLNLW